MPDTKRKPPTRASDTMTLKKLTTWKSHSGRQGKQILCHPPTSPIASIPTSCRSISADARKYEYNPFLHLAGIILSVIFLLLPVSLAATAAKLTVSGPAYGHERLLGNGAQPYFRVTDVKSGLPDNSINDITQDEYGFLWLATWSGLARYDGRAIRQFSFLGDDNPAGLCNAMVRTLLPSSDGIWAGTDNGLDFYDFSSSTFRRSHYQPGKDKEPVAIRQRINSLLRSGRYIFAVVNGNLMRHAVDSPDHTDEKGDIHPLFTLMPNPRERRYMALASFTEGRILALSNQGVTLLSNDGTKELRHFGMHEKFDAKKNLHCDTINGRLYIGGGFGAESHAFRIDPKNGTIHPDPDLFVPSNLTRCTMQRGLITFATDGDGIWTERHDGGFDHFTMTNSSMPGDAVYTVFTDRSGDLWIGTYRRGLAFFSRQLNWFTFATQKTSDIPYDIVTAAHPFKGKIYLGLDGGGLAVYDPVTRHSVQYNKANSAMPGDNVVSITDDGERIWMGVYTSGLVSFSPETHEISHYPLPEHLESGNNVWVVCSDSSGDIWTGGRNLNVFTPSTKTFQNVANTDGIDVTAIVRDGANMWIGSHGSGVIKFNAATRRQLLHASNDTPNDIIRLPEYFINNLWMDSKGKLWLSEGRHGFFSVDPTDASTLRNYGPEQGLFDNRVKSIVEDSRGMLWIGTYSGLYRCNPDAGSFIKIDDPRLPTMFNSNAGGRDNETIYIGSTTGLVSFAPSAEMFNNQAAVPLRFTDIHILGPTGGDISLYAGEPDRIELTHEQNFFTINFAVPDMIYPGRVRYSYRLVGLDKGWSVPTESGSAEYTSVPPGKYSFEVRHTMPDGSWSEVYSFPLSVRPPWWGTWWAALLLALIVIAIVLTVLYFWREHILSRQQMEIAIIERESERKLNDTKLDFFAKISHELRTPVFLITAQIEELLSMGKDVSSVRKSQLDTMYRNSQKLNRLINRVIDFRKVDLGRGSLNYKHGDIVAFLAAQVDDYENLCQQKDISFSYISTVDSIATWYDSDCLDQIVSNLITNAYKYTHPGGHVSLKVSSDGNVTTIRIKDTGIGISEKMQHKVFDPYFRTERGKSESKGDGIGLAYVKELTELAGGTITLKSAEGEGTTFTVTLPVIKERPSDENTTVADGRKDLFKVSTPRSQESRLTAGLQNPTATHSILIVEDDEDIAKLLLRTFSNDFRVYLSPNGKDALSQLSKILPDIMLTDLSMPEMDGHELIRRVRANPELRHLMVAVLTAVNTEDDMVKALDEGADAYFTKPLSLKVLSRQIQRMVGFRRSDSYVTAGMPRRAPAAAQANSSKYPTEDKLSEPSIAEIEVNRPDSGESETEKPKKTEEKRDIPLTEEDKKFIVHCRRIIDDNIQNPDFDIEFLSKQLAMSHSALYKRIRKLTGMSLVEFITDYRICKAINLIHEGNTNVQKVGELVGFRDSKTFRTVFKRKMGMSPKPYIQSLV